MDIGSAKPRRRAAASLIDLRDFGKPTARGIFAQIVSKSLGRSLIGKNTLLVGGTQMYYKSLIELDSGLPEANAELREQIRSQAKKEGWPALHAQLAQCDPVTAARLHPNHSSRIERA